MAELIKLMAEERMAEPIKLMVEEHMEEHMKMKAVEEHWAYEHMMSRVDYLSLSGVLHPCFPSSSKIVKGGGK